MTFHQDFICQNDNLTYQFTLKDFELSYWESQPDTQLLAGGRGGSIKIGIDQNPYVLHRYLRGGMVAKFL